MILVKWFIDCVNVTYVFIILILGYCCSSDPIFFFCVFFREVPRHKALFWGREGGKKGGRERGQVVVDELRSAMCVASSSQTLTKPLPTN